MRKTLGQFTLFFSKSGWTFSIVLRPKNGSCWWVSRLFGSGFVCGWHVWSAVTPNPKNGGNPTNSRGNGGWLPDWIDGNWGFISRMRWRKRSRRMSSTEVFSLFPFWDPGWEKRAEKCCRQKFGIRIKLPLESRMSRNLFLMGFLVCYFLNEWISRKNICHLWSRTWLVFPEFLSIRPWGSSQVPSLAGDDAPV